MYSLWIISIKPHLFQATDASLKLIFIEKDQYPNIHLNFLDFYNGDEKEKSVPHMLL